jgi:hypothetical protein
MGRKTVQHADKRVQQGFVMVPRAVLFDTKLSPGAKVLYAILKGYAWQDESCWPGTDRLAEGIGVSFNTLKKWRDELVENELLTVERRGQGQTNIMWIIEPRTSKSELLEPQTLREK